MRGRYKAPLETNKSNRFHILNLSISQDMKKEVSKLGREFEREVRSKVINVGLTTLLLPFKKYFEREGKSPEVRTHLSKLGFK